LKSGLSDFLKRGFTADNIDVGPSGFSVLFFYPGTHTEVDGDDFNVQQLRETYGEGELPENLMKAFCRKEVYVPSNVYEAWDQIRCALAFLNAICGDRNIASEGYQVGLETLQRHPKKFEIEMSNNKMFLVSFLYMLDRSCQSYCLELRGFEFEQDPILAARANNMNTWMGKFIKDAVPKWLVTGIVPQFSSPTSMSGAQVGRVVDLTVGGGPGGRGRGGQGGRAADRAGGAAGAGGQHGAADRAAGGAVGGADQAWHKEMPGGEYVAEWQIPRGREFLAYFGGPNPVERLNKLPKVTHHRSGRPAPLCLRYQLENVKSGRGTRCGLAHIRPREIRRADHEKVTAHLRSVYAQPPQPAARADQPGPGRE
jgi:hypothetical protein